MPAGKLFSEAVVERTRLGPEFAAGMFSDSATRLVNGKIRFQALAGATRVPDKGLHRVLMHYVSPILQNRTNILRALREALGAGQPIEAAPLSFHRGAQA